MNANCSGANIALYSPLQSGDDLIYTAIRPSLEQHVWMLQPVNLSSRTGWSVWCANLREAKVFVFITERWSPVNAFIVVLPLHSKETECDFVSSYIPEELNKIEDCDLGDFLIFQMQFSKQWYFLRELKLFWIWKTPFYFHQACLFEVPIFVKSGVVCSSYVFI
jgi:hypothetical protein